MVTSAESAPAPPAALHPTAPVPRSTPAGRAAPAFAAPRGQTAVADQVGFDAARSESSDDAVNVDVPSTAFAALDPDSINNSIAATTNDPTVSNVGGSIQGVMP
ncbi:MAG TPA: hypothetical protein VHN98_04065, partial [Acidimicrobiales bacterium]|nr:hypothetical protein [Acidimicrobiales bacterium]